MSGFMLMSGVRMPSPATLISWDPDTFSSQPSRCCFRSPSPAAARIAKPTASIPVSFQADWYPQPEHGGFYDALAKGYYKQEGLDVTILPGGPYVADEALVATGQIQFAMNSSDHVLESIANAGEPIVAVGATMQHDPQGIMVHANSPVHTWTDLNGQTVAVRPGSTWWEFITATFHLDRVHEIPATYSVANFLQDPNYIQQGFLTSEPYFAAKGGAQSRFLLNRDAGYDPYRVFYTSQSFAQSTRHRRQVRARLHPRLARLHAGPHRRQRPHRKTQPRHEPRLGRLQLPGPSSRATSSPATTPPAPRPEPSTPPAGRPCTRNSAPSA
jgi:hypothetical protein